MYSTSDLLTRENSNFYISFMSLKVFFHDDLCAIKVYLFYQNLIKMGLDFLTSSGIISVNRWYLSGNLGIPTPPPKKGFKCVPSTFI